MSGHSLGRVRPWAGVIGPLLLNVVIVVLGAARDDHDASRDFISALSLGPQGWIQRVNFVICGGLLSLFAPALAGWLPSGVAARRAAWLCRVIGTSLVGAGAFNMDPLDGTTATISGAAHLAFAFLCIVAMPPMCFAVAASIASQAPTAALASRAVGVIVALLFAVVALGFPIPALGPILQMPPVLGLFERLGEAVFFAWLMAVACQMALTSRSARGVPA